MRLSTYIVIASQSPSGYIYNAPHPAGIHYPICSLLINHNGIIWMLSVGHQTHLVQIELDCLPAASPDLALGFPLSPLPILGSSCRVGWFEWPCDFVLARRLSRITSACVHHRSTLMNLMDCHSGGAREDNPAIMQ